MTHGVAITAYTDFPALRNLVRQLADMGFVIAVHIDQKSSYSSREVDEIASLGAIVRSTYRIGWGNYNHLLAIIELLDIILDNSEVSYVHVASGQDIVIADKEEFLDVCDGRIFMDVVRPHEMRQIISNRYTTRDWFWPIEGFPGHRFLRSAARKIQRSVGFLRRHHIGPYSEIYKGLIWVSMPVSVCANAVSTAKTNGFLRDLRSVELPEEFFFQTLIMNSADSILLAKSNLRFYDWRGGNSRSPVFLNESHVSAALSSHALFARKFDTQISGMFLERFQEAVSRAPRPRFAQR